MKRSEMAKKLNDWSKEICEADNLYWESWGEAQWIQLLTRMENAGMFPPTCETNILQAGVYHYVTTINKWEKENE